VRAARSAGTRRRPSPKRNAIAPITPPRPWTVVPRPGGGRLDEDGLRRPNRVAHRGAPFQVEAAPLPLGLRVEARHPGHLELRAVDRHERRGNRLRPDELAGTADDELRHVGLRGRGGEVGGECLDAPHPSPPRDQLADVADEAGDRDAVAAGQGLQADDELPRPSGVGELDLRRGAGVEHLAHLLRRNPRGHLGQRPAQVPGLVAADQPAQRGVHAGDAQLGVEQQHPDRHTLHDGVQEIHGRSRAGGNGVHAGTHCMRRASYRLAVAQSYPRSRCDITT
jgi:hypothetical protein